jgi:hypothetical protein
MTAANEQYLEVTDLKIANQFTQPGAQAFEWRVFEGAIATVEVPIVVVYDMEPRPTEDVIASLIYPAKGGGVIEKEVHIEPRQRVARLNFVPEAFGDVWLALHYQGKLYFEDMFSIGPL